jgi:hypothetical protein
MWSQLPALIFAQGELALHYMRIDKKGKETGELSPI